MALSVTAERAPELSLAGRMLRRSRALPLGTDRVGLPSSVQDEGGMGGRFHTVELDCLPDTQKKAVGNGLHAAFAALRRAADNATGEQLEGGPLH